MGREAGPKFFLKGAYMTKNFRTYNLAQEFFKQCQKLKLKSYLRDQLDRASLSVCLNLVEGSAKTSEKERLRFYLISYASFKECQSILSLINQDKIVEQYDLLGAFLYRLSH